MQIQIITIDQKFRVNAPLYNNTPNQIKRIVGRYETVYCGGHECGTIRDANGQFWDWWLTDEVLNGGFRKVRVEKAV